jgi:hypothetical protein
MKFLADENFPMPSVTVLREAGHNVQHIGEFAGASVDEDVDRPRWCVRDVLWRPFPCSINCSVLSPRSLPQDLLHGLALGQFIDEQRRAPDQSTNSALLRTYSTAFRLMLGTSA